MYPISQSSLKSRTAAAPEEAAAGMLRKTQRHGMPVSVPIVVDEQSRVPCVPLTDRQAADYRKLVARAACLRSAGRYDEAARNERLAADILRTGAPGFD